MCVCVRSVWGTRVAIRKQEFSSNKHKITAHWIGNHVVISGIHGMYLQGLCKGRGFIRRIHAKHQTLGRLEGWG